MITKKDDKPKSARGGQSGNIKVTHLQNTVPVPYRM